MNPNPWTYVHLNFYYKYFYKAPIFQVCTYTLLFFEGLIKDKSSGIDFLITLKNKLQLFLQIFYILNQKII